MQLYAKIKKNSKYSGQEKGLKDYPFPIEIVDARDDYIVRGGPGVNYRLKDLSLFVKVNGKNIKIKG
ncbi:Uncharacterized protein dnl_63070 [Desulfonema limicola]|uniref:Uncharacterized protein n=1 Tax=Desulfonema limicola TaxID=45656 RepID=A0A975BEK5_9BACT|nr:hypothetical protein [Desulfonema limicola]QTA83883.1 Uncharacterized protein dnl_63070 [Desulfonema limicola]